jgi:multidrug efflux pump subunit AcrB
MKNPSKKAALPKDQLLSKITLWFFDRSRLTASLFLIIFLFGILSYTTFLKREGFPAINLPIASINGTYAAGDAKVVDTEVAGPIAKMALEQPGVVAVSSNSYENFFGVMIQYEEGINAEQSIEQLENTIAKSKTLPIQAQVSYTVPYFGATGPASERIDIAVAFFSKNKNQKTSDIISRAELFAESLRKKNLPLVETVTVQDPFDKAINPETGQVINVQQTFDRFGERVGQTNEFYNSVTLGIKAREGFDVIKLDQQVRDAVRDISRANANGYDAKVSASFAPSIKDNISELQRVLLEALVAILIVGSLVIAVRASIITVVSLLSVLAATIGLLYLLGYTLNVITLFALILSLALIVDDTIIMVEAIDAQRKRTKDRRKAVQIATKKVSRAMIAATTTAALSFAPLLFVGGILGSFIRAIPVTIISALAISLLFALIFIPLLANYFLLGKKQMGETGVKEVASELEHKIARFIAGPMLWAKGSIKRLAGVGLAAVLFGFLFIGAGVYMGSKVAFNIFPPSKDTNGMQIALAFPPGTTIEEAQKIVDRANKITAEEIGGNFEQATYTGTANERIATMQMDLISYADRADRAPQIVEDLQNVFDSFEGAAVKVTQIDAGPPASPFTVRIDATDRGAAFRLAADLASFLEGLELTRASGQVAKVTSVNLANPGVVSRTDGIENISVSAEFDDIDVSTLYVLAENRVEAEFPSSRVETYGLPGDAIKYDIGQESENQESFKTLVYAFPAVLFVIYILLAVQFRSLLQPLLIFMAIPFSLLGITLSLYLTDNPFSFFAMLGFFALIGLSIKNSILLTDYANQSRRAGMGPVDSVVEALRERFRPLVATSLTAVVSLIPLSIISPFWQGLAVLIIFGLLSSTFLVLTVFPYYYLGVEYVRGGFKKRFSRLRRA